MHLLTTTIVFTTDVDPLGKRRATKSRSPHPIPAKPCKTNPNDLKVLYLNARSLKSFVPADNDTSNKVCKITLLQELAYGGEYEVVCICETWLNNTILDTELLPGFNIFRWDRTGRIDGGVLIAIRENLHATRCCDLERDDIELAVVQLSKANNEPVILYVYYRPPNQARIQTDATDASASVKIFTRTRIVNILLKYI
jgi:hypothetical protein